MALNKFGYYVSADPTVAATEEQYFTFMVEPKTYDPYSPYGRPVHVQDGAVQYLSQPSFVIIWPNGLLLNTLPTGVASSTGTIKHFMEKFREAQITAQGIMQFNYFDPISGTFIQNCGKPRKPQYRIRGKGLAPQFAIEVLSLGVNTLDYDGGVLNPPDGDNPDDAGDPYYGAYGWGYYGAGYYSQGSNLL
jgi:hypothetical protein